MANISVTFGQHLASHLTITMPDLPAGHPVRCLGLGGEGAGGGKVEPIVPVQLRAVEAGDPEPGLLSSKLTTPEGEEGE